MVDNPDQCDLETTHERHLYDVEGMIFMCEGRKKDA